MLVTHLPEFRADYDDSPLVSATAAHAQSIEATDLFALMLEKRLRCFGLVTSQGPNFHYTSSSEAQNNIIWK